MVVEKSMVEMMNEGKLTINWLIARKGKQCEQDEFLCNQSNYCIKSTHYCNRIDDCPYDASDEPEKCIFY